MPSIHDPHVRLFATVALQRLEDAEWLFESGRYNACIYIAGYVVECGLKALLLSVSTKTSRAAVVQSFRSGRGHDFEDLRSRYLSARGAGLPREIVHAFSEVQYWTTAMRYVPKSVKSKDAQRFMNATRMLYSWMKGRM